MKKILNEWQIHFRFAHDPARYERGWRQVEFGILKIHTIPDRGDMLTKGNYDGFILRFLLWLPVDTN